MQKYSVLCDCCGKELAGAEKAAIQFRVVASNRKKIQPQSAEYTLGNITVPGADVCNKCIRLAVLEYFEASGILV